MSAQNQFVDKHGHKHHNYPPGKAPYPISYDRDILDSDATDHHLWRSLFDGRPTMMVTPNYPPRRVLDLGCGVGMWTIDAARKWPDTTFVGFDIVNVQFPLGHLEPHVARRINWEHGNFLSTKLPFEDDTFDHVHIMHVSKGVPEHKWSSLFEEVRRVMQPDGFVEITEEDIIFPVLPRWFTEPLRANDPSGGVRSNSSDSSPLALPSPPLTPVEKVPHEHVLLEYLFNSVFESRFINMKPTVVVLGYFTPFFSRCLSAPSLNFSVPFLAPLPPLPEATRPTTQYFGNFDPTSSIPDVPSYPNTRPSPYSRTVSRSSSSLSLPSLDCSRSRSPPIPDDTGSRTPTVASVHNRLSSSPATSNERTVNSPQSSVTRVASWITSSETPTLDNALLAQSIVPVETLSKLGERTRAMNLYHSFMVVLGCREAMWEELKMLQRSRRNVLIELGWESRLLEDREARVRFDELFEHFESDMRARISMWYSMTELGYPLPKREPLHKAELLEEERIRKAILDARAQAREEDFDVPCRVIRVFIGFKEADSVDALEKSLTSER
ncbi:hypothetical protein B0F90DRAFT_1680486 [Multifurca ochricompacta]|uniref:Methyltransferase domain-containing protein n=1 Tax=Multifurca ochricompacta TaxID=376703 RepID=A0AAD4MD13_9AGAM|nr:hypothetical protein B0F90DRAFT_1680486 [Multifurca ochricompacta]